MGSGCQKNFSHTQHNRGIRTSTKGLPPSCPAPQGASCPSQTTHAPTHSIKRSNTRQTRRAGPWHWLEGRTQGARLPATQASGHARRARPSHVVSTSALCAMPTSGPQLRRLRLRSPGDASVQSYSRIQRCHTPRCRVLSMSFPRCREWVPSGLGTASRCTTHFPWEAWPRCTIKGCATHRWPIC